MAVISEDSINAWIVPQLSKGKRGPGVSVKVSQIVSAIIYRLKTGCQWRELPVGQFFSEAGIGWQGVYYHFSRWVKDGSFKKVWLFLLKAQRRLLDLSSIQLDGSQTICKNGGECIGYQGRKAAKTCNSLFLSDSKGVMLVCSPPTSGQHHDLYQIEAVFKDMVGFLREAGLDTEGLFLNADAGFDSEGLRKLCAEMKIEANIDFNPRNGQTKDEYVCFDEELFKRRRVIEHANAWLDSFKALLIRFETKAHNWLNLHYLAFAVLFIRRISQNQKL